MSRFFYRIIRALVWLFYPRITVSGTENLPEEPVILVGNHCQMNGPIAAELYAPRPRYTWCASEMMELHEVAEYAYQDFWINKPRWIRWFYRLLSYIIPPLSVCVFTNACTIPVYRDLRITKTFRQTMERLSEGADVVIFPEKEEPYNRIIYAFQDHFIDVARLYWKRTGKAVSFVPFYLAPALKTMVLGTCVTFDPSVPIEEERARICRLLMEQITDMAEALPPHRVVPYPNLPKREYPFSREESPS